MSKLLPLKRATGNPATPRAMMARGSVEWCDSTLQRLRWAFDQKTITDREFENLVGDLDLYEAWTKVPEGHPYGSREAMLRAEIGLTFDEAQARVKSLAEAATPLSSPGAPAGNVNAAKVDETHKENKRDNIPFVSPRGTSAEHLAARIARDRPDILDRMKNGEFPSVRAAAREAGIVRERITILTEPRAAAAQIRKHFDPESVRELARLLTEAVNHE